MPSLFALKERDAFSLHCLSDYCEWPFAFFGQIQGNQNLRDVMPVDYSCIPAKGFEFYLIHLDIMAVHCLLALAKPVHIDDCAEVVSIMVHSGICALPYSAFCAFSIPNKNIYPSIAFAQLFCKCHSNACCQALAKAACRNPYPWHVRGRMAFKIAVYFPQCVKAA